LGLRQSKNTDMERGGYSRYLKVDSFLFIIAEFQYNNLIKITRWSFDDLRSFSFSAVIRNSDKESVTVCLSTYYFYIFVDNNQIQGRSDLRCQLFSSSLALNASSFLSSSKNILCPILYLY